MSEAIYMEYLSCYSMFTYWFILFTQKEERIEH